MKREAFIDIMGEIDDRFYREAEELLCPTDLETVKPVMITPKKKSPAGMVIPIAASVALIGTLGAAVYFGGKIGTADPNTEITAENTTDIADIITEEKEEEYIDYCKEYVYEQSREVFEREEDPLVARIIDLNLDGRKEIMVTTKTLYCPVFVFEEPVFGEENPVFVNTIADNLNTGHEEFLNGLYPYEEDNGEKYCYYYFRSNQNAADTRALTAVKYDEEKGYYLKGLLSYGTVSYEGTAIPDAVFFRNYVDIYDITSTGESGITEEAFRELWGKYDRLPPISFNDADITDLSLYTNIENAELPDIHGDYSEIMSSSPDSLYPKVKLCTLGERDRLFTVVGENVRTDSSKNPDMVYFGSLYLVYSQSGKVTSVKKIELADAAVNGEYALKKDTWKDDQPSYYASGLLSEFRIAQTWVTVFTNYLDNREYGYSNPQEKAFFVEKEGVIYQLRGDLSGLRSGSLSDKSVVMANYFYLGKDTALKKVYSIVDAERRVEYEFDPEALKNPETAGFSFTAIPFDMSEEELLNIKPWVYGETEIPDIPAENPQEDGRTSPFPISWELEKGLDKMIFETHSFGDYTISLIGEYVRTDGNHPNMIYASRLYAAVYIGGIGGESLYKGISPTDIKNVGSAPGFEYVLLKDKIGSYLDIYQLENPVLAIRYYYDETGGSEITKTVDFGIIQDDKLKSGYFWICDKNTGVEFVDSDRWGTLNRNDGNVCLTCIFESEEFEAADEKTLVDRAAGLKYTFGFSDPPQQEEFTVQRISY